MSSPVTPVLAALGTIILGKSDQLKLALACLLARGHLLIEDLPGMGKTTLAEALARVLGLSYQRIQFTSDMLPADIIGVSVFNPQSQQFDFRPGPVFTQVLLADEINRTTAKTQSALLEAMEEHQVSADGVTRKLPDPFFVIATQNPSSQMGTFPLPESQLDRFLMRIQLGYPDPRAERALLTGGDRRTLLASLKPLAGAADLKAWQQAITKVHVSDAVLDYLQRLVGHTRTAPGFQHGLSPRGALALMRAAQSWAFVSGRDHVQPEDVQAVLPSVAEHRLRGGMEDHGRTHSLTTQLLKAVDVIG
ncbi:MAG TPA: MoxR family ATPase [Moraxellaceae bacterium]|nr:MoxR family ATPase [Moraxellaceae bacterium]